MTTKKLAWGGEIGCEGGPVLVANLEDFEHWLGSEPFAPSRATELHFWSQFTSDLPEEWLPTGTTGHQYLASSDRSWICCSSAGRELWLNAAMGADHVHRFGQGAMGYLWSAGPGLVRINIEEARDSLLLTQVEFADDEMDAQRAYEYALKAGMNSAEPGTQYRVASGPVVVAWSPNSARDLSNIPTI